MYFMVENTPESVKKQRREQSPEPEPVEERPCLSLAPFSRPPLVLFENVPVGSCAERELDVVNPTKRTIQLQLSMGRPPPPGFVVCLPDSQLELAPQHAYTVTLQWRPQQLTAQRETVHFTDQYRGKYEVILVLKTIVINPMKKLKSKKSPKKIAICSPNPRVTKPTKKVSPKLLTQKKTFSHSRIQQFVADTLIPRPQKMYSNKENLSPQPRQSVSSQKGRFCPFESLTSLNSADSFNFNITTSDIFGMRGKENQTYSEISGVHKFDYDFITPVASVKQTRSVLSPSTRYNADIASAIDNLTFTPLKNVPKVKVTSPTSRFVNYETEYVDSIEVDKKIDSETHSIIMIKSHEENDFNTHFEHQGATADRPVEFSFSVESTIHSKKIPNTSSPKHFNSPAMNFTMNTEFSHITDTTFFPQRCSTERKITFNKGYHDNFADTPEGVEKHYNISSDTYVKPESSLTLDQEVQKVVSPPYLGPQIQNAARPPHLPPYPRHLEFNERVATLPSRFSRNCGDGVKNIIEANLWQADKSPPQRIVTPPPLQSIPEESTQYSVSHVDRTNPAYNTFTIDRTFDKPRESFSKPRDSISSWQKKSVRCEPGLWKKPTRIKEQIYRQDFPTNEIVTENVNNMTTNSALHHISDVYTQASTVDPFLSSTYFYDEEAVDKFEREFKRWLNYILTPPADLESNLDETKVDVGKIWTENRHKEIPAAPTREQVSSQYHNNHRLESVRKSARALMLSPSIVDVFKKLNAQIDKKLISMRPDKNLPMDVGLQKIITGLLLCYNPLWLRIGLETLYGTVIPMNSNSDVFGLTTFIIQRFFKDPYAKNKHSHPSVPNMLLPSYLEYMRKFTLKKFFMLVFFLDQAKQKKLMFHDPCLFCRNAQYKESRDLLIQFTRELIAGIGDITRHLRPLGYVVSHKQCYLDEYKYAVHNLAIDLKDGIRLTRVMEIILVKPGLMNLMRTPPVSRLQKIHNVKVALTALKDTNFNIVGDITAKDIADGHREKTLSLLWQIIHVFRAPLFEKASIVIQTWWKKKYLGIAIKKRIEHKKEMKKHIAASVIQTWWRQIQYQRQVEKNERELQAACIVVQKYWRMWSCRNKYLKYKWAVRNIEEWYRSAKEKKQADEILRQLLLEQRSVAQIQMWYRRMKRAREYTHILDCYLDYCKETKLKIEATNTIKNFLKKIIILRKFREIVTAAVEVHMMKKLLNNAATIIQTSVRSWICRKKYMILKGHVIKCQAAVRGYLVRKQQHKLLRNVVYVQHTFRNKILMKRARSKFILTKNAAIILQQRYRAQRAMQIQKQQYSNLKTCTINIENRYIARMLMRTQRQIYLNLKQSAIIVQKYFRAKVARNSYLKLKYSVIKIQSIYRANLAMKQQKNLFTETKNAVLIIQRSFRSHHLMKQQQKSYIAMRAAAITIQRFVRANKSKTLAREYYLTLRYATIVVQRRYRAHTKMIMAKLEYAKIRKGIIVIQTRYRALIAMRQKQAQYKKVKEAAIIIQRRYRATKSMKLEKQAYDATRNACLTVQKYFRLHVKRKNERNNYLKLKQATIVIQQRFREKKLTQKTLHQYVELKNACLSIQHRFRANKLAKQERQQYLKLKQAVITVQRIYCAKLLKRQCEVYYTTLKRVCITVQQIFRAKLSMRSQRDKYLALRKATVVLQNRYRAKKLKEKSEAEYNRIKYAAIVLQRRFRARKEMIFQQAEYRTVRTAALVFQRRFRAHVAMKTCSQEYKHLRNSVIAIQNRFRANRLRKEKHAQYLRMKSAASHIKTWYRATKTMQQQRIQYLSLIEAVRIVQSRYRALLSMRKMLQHYNQMKKSAIIIQQSYRAKKKGIIQRETYMAIRESVFKIQIWYRSILQMRLDKQNYFEMKEAKMRKEAAEKIQVWYRSINTMRTNRMEFLMLRKYIIKIQATYKMYRIRKHYIQIRSSTIFIQTKYRSYRSMKVARQQYLTMRSSAIKIQETWKCWKTRKMYVKLLSAVRNIQMTYRRRKWLEDMRAAHHRRIEATICIQKYYRGHACAKAYALYRENVIFVQRHWRRKIMARKMRATAVAMVNGITKLQALARGYLARQRVRQIREAQARQKDEQRRHDAASKIQALFRGNRVREQMKHQPAVAEMRQKLTRAEPAQKQDTIESQNEYALDVLTHYSDIPSIIRAFVIIEYLTEVYPMIYHKTCNRVAVSLLNYMMMTNRSVSTLDTVRPAAAILVNMARYKHTALIIYSREKIANVLKLILRWSGQDSKYYCALCTFLWLFGKYDHIRKDIGEFLHESENRNMMVLIRAGVLRKQRMKDNASRTKTYTPKPVKCVTRSGHASMNASCRSDFGSTVQLSAVAMPALEPDYGFKRAGKPRYFENDLLAIDSVFNMFGVSLK